MGVKNNNIGNRNERHNYALEIALANLEIDLPDLFTCMIPEDIDPSIRRQDLSEDKREKRMRISGHLHGFYGNIHEEQMNQFLYYNLHVFYGGEYSCWKHHYIDTLLKNHSEYKVKQSKQDIKFQE